MPQRSGAKPFSTRFLPSDGIPDYNALLDERLGKRREYLLGNRKSLELLQQTGVIARVERQGDNANQYVVHVAPKTGSNQHSHNLRRKRPPSLPSSTISDERDHEALWRALPPYGSTSSFTLRNSATAPDLGVAGRMRAMRIHEEDEEEECGSGREEDDQQEDKEELVQEMEAEEKGISQWQPQQDNSSRGRDSVATAGATQVPNRFADRPQVSGSIDDRRTGPTYLNSSSTTSFRVAALKNLGRSRSTMTLVRKPSVAPLMNGQRHPNHPVNAGLPALSEAGSGAGRHRSRSVIAISASPVGNSGDSPASNDMLKLAEPNSRDAKSKSAATATSSSSGKTTVEHLLESDTAFASQIRAMKEQLADLTAEKARLDGEIAKVRRKLKGVNAVRENDVAVAHCAAVMQQRLAKAEEEYMKLVTAQQQVKTAVDRVRHELLSLKAVRRKLETDIDDVMRSNAAIKDKIHATKLVRNSLSEELTSLERQAEQELEEQKLSLPPEDAVVVDVARLMNAAANARQTSSPRSKAPPTVLLDDPPLALTSSPSKADGPRSGSKKEPQPHRRRSVDYVSAFKQVQLALGSFTDAETLVQAFNKTEEQLLAKYQATLELKDELAALEKEQAILAQARAERHATIRGNVQASASAELMMQQKLHALQIRIASYNELRESRNQEHSRLRGVMLRCLEILQAESMLASFFQTLQPTRSMTSTISSSSLLSRGSSGNGLTTTGGPAAQATASSSARPLLMSELSSSVMLEALQKKMTEVTMALKVKHSARIAESPRACFHTNPGKGGRRSNMFSTREVSKIVLGPRGPPGSTLAAIMESVQPPSVEVALAMTETGTGYSDTTSANGGRAGGGSVDYPVGEIIIAEKKAVEHGSPLRPPDGTTRRRKTSFAQ